MTIKILLLLMTVLSCTYARGSYYSGYERTPVGDAIDRFSFKLLKEAYDNADDKNIIASPLGVLTLLSMYASATEGEIKEEIVQALGFSNYSQVFASYSGLSSEFFEMNPDFLTFAIKIYVSDQYALSDAFKSVITHSYRSEIEKINFQDTTTATNTINNWAEHISHGHIKNPVPGDAIAPDTVAALFNFIYFQGNWNVAFTAGQTKDEDFFLDRLTPVKKPTMHVLRPLLYDINRKIGVELLELPYKETHFRMVVVLPREIDGLPALMEKVATQGLLTEVLELKPSYNDIDLYMPKFEIDSGLDLNVLLPKIGVSKIFNESAYGMVEDAGVYVSKAFQKAFVKTDEAGTTAGALTGHNIRPMSALYKRPRPTTVMGGKRASVSPDGKRLAPPMDTRNTRGVTSALPASKLNILIIILNLSIYILYFIIMH